ncbi:MAG: adenylate/guanylate cyclase domain-containing protein, partial [Myxococcota bacterium]|nr:adenylate/guanylate cyclase domain-containing protein [Myxococcota bacterium]
ISFNVLSDHYIMLGTLGQWMLLGGAVGLHASQMEEQRREALEAQIMEERRNNELRDAFGRYVAPDLAAKLLKDPDAMKMGGRLQNITILMSDLRGFTGMTKLLGPPAMCELLNDYLSRMTEVIERHGGWVNEFIGDAILTIFGTPVSGDEDAMNACRCAIDMQLALQKLNQELTSAGRPTLEMGIGLHTGDAIVGNIGSKRRVKWGVIGDPVNMTARIESLTVGTQVLMSTDVLALVKGRVEVTGFRNVNVKGRSIPLEVAELRGIVGENVMMPVLEDVYHPVNLRGRLRRMHGKEIEQRYFSIKIVQLGRLGLLFRSESLGAVSDVSIELETEDGFSLPIYGKVKNVHADHTEMLKEVVFTSSNAQLERRMKVILEKKSTSE